MKRIVAVLAFPMTLRSTLASSALMELSAKSPIRSHAHRELGRR